MTTEEVFDKTKLVAEGFSRLLEHTSSVSGDDMEEIVRKIEHTNSFIRGCDKEELDQQQMVWMDASVRLVYLLDYVRSAITAAEPGVTRH